MGFLTLSVLAFLLFVVVLRARPGPPGQPGPVRPLVHSRGHAPSQGRPACYQLPQHRQGPRRSGGDPAGPARPGVPGSPAGGAAGAGRARRRGLRAARDRGRGSPLGGRTGRGADPAARWHRARRRAVGPAWCPAVRYRRALPQALPVRPAAGGDRGAGGAGRGGRPRRAARPVPEVADIVATLRVLHDPAESAALARLLTGPRWRIGPSRAAPATWYRCLGAIWTLARSALGESYG